MASMKMPLALSAAVTAGLLVLEPSFTLSPAGAGSVLRPDMPHQPKVGAGLLMLDADLVGEADATSSFRSYGAVALLASAAFLAGSSFATKSQPKAASKKERCFVSLAAFENELGVQAPIGFWDPLGFTADGNVASFKRRRSVEIKHSRVCMMASIGYIQPEFTGKWPGFLSPSAGLKFADIPNGLAAISKVPALGWAQIVAYCGFVEFSGGFEDYKSGTPGDYGWKVITSGDMTERTKKTSRRDCQWSSRNDGDNWHVLPGRPHWFSMGRLGSLHWFATQG